MRIKYVVYNTDMDEHDKWCIEISLKHKVVGYHSNPEGWYIETDIDQETASAILLKYKGKVIG